MNPGRMVASPRSMIVASAGIAPPEPTAVIFPSATTTTAGETSRSLLPSYRWDAFNTIGAPFSAAKALAENRETKSRQVRIADLLSVKPVVGPPTLICSALKIEGVSRESGLPLSRRGLPRLRQLEAIPPTRPGQARQRRSRIPVRD